MVSILFIFSASKGKYELKPVPNWEPIVFSRPLQCVDASLIRGLSEI